MTKLCIKILVESDNDLISVSLISVSIIALPALPLEPIEPAPLLSQTIKGWHAPRANPSNPLYLFPKYHSRYIPKERDAMSLTYKEADYE